MRKFRRPPCFHGDVIQISKAALEGSQFTYEVMLYSFNRFRCDQMFEKFVCVMHFIRRDTQLWCLSGLNLSTRRAALETARAFVQLMSSKSFQRHIASSGGMLVFVVQPCAIQQPQCYLDDKFSKAIR
jgi:hypothetical protein